MVNRMNDFEKEKTDSAWRKVKARLQAEELLECTSQENHTPNYSITKRSLAVGLSIAAMIAIMFVMNNLFFADGKDSNIAMLEQVNSQESSLVTTLADGSIVYLGKDGKLEYPEEFLSDTRNVNLKGDAFFEVAKNRKKPFIITTPDVTIEVLGTSFSITKSDKFPFMLNVRSGKVKVVDRKTNEVVYVEKGESVSLSSGHLTSFVSKENPMKAFVKEFRFKDQSLKVIVGVLNSLSADDKIELEGDIDSRKLTVAFSGEQIDQMAKLIGIALDLNIDKNNNTIYLSDK